MTSGDLRGREGRSPTVQILSISCSFWEIFSKPYVGAPPESWRPHLGEMLDPPLMTTDKMYNVLNESK